MPAPLGTRCLMSATSHCSFRKLATLRTDIALVDDVDELQWQGPKAGFDTLGARLAAARAVGPRIAPILDSNR